MSSLLSSSRVFALTLSFLTIQALAQEDLEHAVRKRISPQRLREFLAEVSKEPHVAGSEANERLAGYLKKQFEAHGLETELATYDVLLSYPEDAALELLKPKQRVLLSLEGERLGNVETLTREERLPWNAYSPSAEITGQVVYANFGRPEDFQTLENLGIDVRGKIVLTRYGQGYRGGKSLEAERRGAAAILFYSDPEQDGYVQGEILPKGPWGPPDHFQRGANVYDFIVPGDPLTPGWPSTDRAKRIKPEQSKILPKIPSLPLSYQDVWPVLEALQGPVVPKNWQGGLPFTYHIGPGPAELRMKVKNKLERRKIINVLGRLRGHEEPEKIVLVSSHHDAWTKGAMDDGIGTAAALELSRIFGELARHGQRPRRSLLFASWDAEEYTLTGSTEWGEEHASHLKTHAVALLNLDAYRWGKEFTGIAVPSLKPLVLQALAAVRDPLTGHPILEEWEKAALARGEKASIGILGSGSDYTVFLNHLGIPVVETMFTGVAGAYHSIYDDLSWVEKVDPGLKYVAAMSEIIAFMALRLADSEILPLDYVTYARDVLALLEELQKIHPPPSLNLSACMEAARSWEQQAMRWEANKNQPLSQKQKQCANAALMQVERKLLHEAGIPGRPWFKHLLYAPRPSYEALSLPGIREAVEAGNFKLAQEQAKILETALRRASAAQARTLYCLK
jgi:N-acetylated-alpha-linked acidic dipeptidase